MPGAGWRQHVRAELQRRERRARGLRVLLERHEKLHGLLDALQTLLAAEEEKGQWPAAGGSCRPPQELASIRVQQEMELIELRREREELHQRVALLTDVLRETEAENKEQRAKMRRLAQDLAALTRRHEEAQCQAWALSQEAEGLRQELAEAQGLMQEAQRKREELEARWVREKALEAGRLNQANEQHDRYQQRVRRLREKLQEAREAAGMIPRPESSPSGSTVSTSCEETSAEGGSSPKVPFPRQPLPCESSLALSEEHLHGCCRWACLVVTARLQLHPGSLPGPQGGGRNPAMSRRACWLGELLRKRGLATPHNLGVLKAPHGSSSAGGWSSCLQNLGVRERLQQHPHPHPHTFLMLKPLNKNLQASVNCFLIHLLLSAQTT